MNARGSPERIVDAHLPDQRTQVVRDYRPPSSRTGFQAPVAAKAGPMPTNDGLWLNDGKDP